MIEWVNDCDSILGNILNIITMVLVVVKYYIFKNKRAKFFAIFECLLLGWKCLKKLKQILAYKLFAYVCVGIISRWHNS